VNYRLVRWYAEDRLIEFDLVDYLAFSIMYGYLQNSPDF